jgi:hypothetical protein
MDMNETQSTSLGIGSNLTEQVYGFSDLVLKARFLDRSAAGLADYPIYRAFSFAARVDLEALYDRIALAPGWRVLRIDTSRMMLDREGVLVRASGTRKIDYCSCGFEIWAATVALAEQTRAEILAEVAAARIDEPMFSIDWYFLTSKGELESATIEEMADDVLYDAAYPELSRGVASFLDDYLDSSEAVLVLQGPPGTGKTRLIRSILGAISRRNGEQAQAMYTGDKRALESDAMFVTFITGWHDVFVLEDADHLLRPRAEGNEHLHRFLTIADGVVRAQGRKIIFSTNLPNVGDLDEALIRPGRCFARVNVRALTPHEGRALVAELCEGDAPVAEAALALLAIDARKIVTLAEAYKAVSQVRAATRSRAPERTIA